MLSSINMMISLIRHFKLLILEFYKCINSHRAPYLPTALYTATNPSVFCTYPVPELSYGAKNSTIILLPVERTALGIWPPIWLSNNVEYCVSPLRTFTHVSWFWADNVNTWKTSCIIFPSATLICHMVDHGQWVVATIRPSGSLIWQPHWQSREIMKPPRGAGVVGPGNE